MSNPQISHPTSVTRRAALAGLAGVLAGPIISAGAGRAFASSLAKLTLFGPPAGPSITLAHAVASGMLSDVAGETSFKAWRNPDEMRAGLTSGSMQAVILPVQAAASLYNRGFKLKLLNVMTKGLLYVISADPAVRDFAGLKGKTLAVPFRNDTPDIILARLLQHYGLAAGTDLTVETVGSPIEAMQMLLTGRVDAVLAPEPAISAAIIMGEKMGKPITRAIDVQKLWGEVRGGEPVLPQAGLAVTDAFAGANPGVADSLQRALETASASVNADPEKAAADAAPALELPAPIIAASIIPSNLVALRASSVRADIESMLMTMSDSDPGLIGGKLPDDGFYL